MVNSKLKNRVRISFVTFLFAVLVFWLPCQGADIKNGEIDPKVGQIEPADWVSECTSVGFWVNIIHNTKDELDAQLDEAAKFGVDSVEGGIYDGGQTNGSSHFSNLQPHIPELGDRDPVREFIDGAHKRGMKATGVFQMFANKFYTKSHPQCRVRPTDDDKYLDDSKSHRGCWNSSFGQYQIDFLVDLVKNYEIDGIASDGFCPDKICYCDSCRKLYKEDTGRELPKLANINAPEYRKYIPWRDKKFNEYTLRLQKALKSVRKDIALFPWFWGQCRFHDFEWRQNSGSMNLLVDVPMLEMFWNWGQDQGNNLPVNFGFKWQTGIGRGRPTLFHPAHKAHVMEFIQLPEAEADFRVYSTITAIAGGGMLGMGWLVKSKPIKYAALVYSEDTDTFFATKDHNDICQYHPWNFGKDIMPWETKKKFDSYLYNCYGAFRAITEEHIPIDIIQDWDIEDGLIDDYKVLILPNTAILSQKAQDNLRKYVKGGGGVVATYLTSMSDTDGNLLNDFGLADMFKVSFEGIENRTDAHKTSDSFHFLEHRITDDPLIKNSNIPRPNDKIANTPFLGKVATVKPKPGANVFITRSAREKTFELPAAISTEYGKGRVVYFPAAVDHAYFSIPVPYERKLLVNSIRYVASAPAPIEVKAPLCVYANFAEQKEKKRIIVHLLNELNTSGGRAMSVGDVPLREEVIPVAGIEILFCDKNIRKVSLQPANKNLELNKSKDGVLVKLPPIGLHTMVVAEKE